MVKKKAKKKKPEFYVSPKEFEQEIREYYDNGVISNKLGLMIKNIAEGLSYRPNFINYCVDEQTEALTEEGWKKYNHINNNDKIICYDITKHDYHNSQLLDLFINKKYNGQMYFLQTKNVESLITPGHKFLTNKGLIAIDDLNKHHDIIFTHNYTQSYNNLNIELWKNYKGTVWCPTTQYGNFVCRRNGTIYVTGNSYKEDMVGDAIVRMFAALKKKKFDLNLKYNPFSYFNQIAFNAFCTRIKKEKKIRKALDEYQEEVYSSELAEYGCYFDHNNQGSGDSSEE